jgi:hypothetical protein
MSLGSLVFPRTVKYKSKVFSKNIWPHDFESKEEFQKLKLVNSRAGLNVFY